MKKNHLYILLSLLIAAFVFLPERAQAAAPTVLKDASSAATKLDIYTSGKGATGSNIPSTELKNAKTKRDYALKKLTAAQKKTYASTIKTINESIVRGDNYIAAVLGGKNLDKYRNQIEVNTKAGKADTNLLLTFSSALDDQSRNLSKVSPSTIKKKIESLYSVKAKKTQSDYSKGITVKKAILEANKKIKLSSDSVAPHFKYVMVNRHEVPQAAYKTALNAEFNKLYSDLATKKKTGKLATYYELEKQMILLDRLVNPGVSAKGVPDLIKTISDSSLYTTSEKALLNKRVNSMFELSPAQIKQKLTSAAIKHGVPPEIVKAVALKESGFKQFDTTGKPFMNSSHNDGGFGIMQVTKGTGISDAALDQARYNIDKNIELGIQILLEKWNYTGIHIPTINTHNKMILEDWYFAVLAYNGISYTNDPNRSGTKPYQVDIYNYIIGSADVPAEILDKKNVAFIQNSQTLGWYLDASKSYTTSRQTKSTQLYKAKDTFTLKKGVKYRVIPSKTGDTGSALTKDTIVTIDKAGVEDTYNDTNLFNWYRVQIQGIKGYWYVASQNFN
ncbi:transglycosylase SLT domain-containing protein [Peribacillus deserti]|uniref:Transglycosylase SLT domain-containing protein n=1 Tax=Peribacillus deserti TaxID=673318 RepID=A0A2N5MBN4_9BACI|nr:transglycosylase SLT domain-containing protein [Peribacillus deserti]PLT31758.1 hypothetical protein CUU66_00925 [Peribacillus deserti]